MHTKEEVISLLKDSSTVNRRKGAKIIFKEGTPDVGEELFEALLKELKNENPDQWETKMEIIKAIGKIGYKKPLGLLFEICKNNKTPDTVALVAATAYVRLKREGPEDLQPVFELLSFNDDSVSNGALRAIGIDGTTAKEEEVDKLIRLCYDLGKGGHPGAGDPREGLIAACSGWGKRQIIIDFLNHCIMTGNSAYSRNLAQKVLENKKVTVSE